MRVITKAEDNKIRIVNTGKRSFKDFLKRKAGGFYTINILPKSDYPFYKTTNKENNFPAKDRDGSVAFYIEIDTERVQKKMLSDAKVSLENAITNHIQSKIEAYNEANGLAFANIDSLQKYTVSEDYPHLPFINAVLLWNIAVWEHARGVMKNVLEGNRALPTVEELLAELPALEY